MLRVFCALLMAAAVTACAASSFKSAYTAPEGKTLVVRPAEWAEYQTYLSMIGNTRQGAFVMHVIDGQSRAIHYSLCEYDTCYGGAAYPNAALNICRREEQGGECVLFASNREILVNYKRAAE
jgi:hypothetical protein